MSFDYIGKLVLIQSALNHHGQNMSYVESRRAQFEAMADDLADIIDAIKQERDALAAQVELLREFAALIVEWKEYGFEKAKSLLDKTPAQCLAEIKAKAIADAVNAHPKTIAYIQHYGQTRSKGGHCDIWLSSSDLIRYANQLRQAAKAGE
jgi:hypothetical protein